MTYLSTVADFWLGLCRKPPAVHALHTGIGIPTESIHEGHPDGGSGGSGTIRRGIGAAISGMRTLNRNRQLLWFTLLAGLVLAGTAIAQGALSYITWAMQPYIGEAEWFVLNGLIEFTTMFCLLFLLAGLVLSISSKKEGYASFSEGLAGAKKYQHAVFAWSVVMALAGMLLFGIYAYSFDWLRYFFSPDGSPGNHQILIIAGYFHSFFDTMLVQFPFNPTLSPSYLFDPYREGIHLSLISWIYPSGILQTLTFSVINLILVVLTPFVIPLIVLEQKSLREAVAGSFAMMKKTWDETAACALFLGVVVSGMFLTYLLVQAVSGLVTPEGVLTMHPENAWIALALVYDSALFCFAIVMATVGGIAMLDLYTSAKSRLIAAEFAESTEPRGL